MSTFVVVHGGFGGAWEWTPVAGQLRSYGHDVFTPTLTGMGERAHLAGPHVGLDTHIEDVVAAMEMEDLTTSFCARTATEASRPQAQPIACPSGFAC